MTSAPVIMSMGCVFFSGLPLMMVTEMHFASMNVFVREVSNTCVKMILNNRSSKWSVIWSFESPLSLIESGAVHHWGLRVLFQLSSHSQYGISLIRAYKKIMKGTETIMLWWVCHKYKVLINLMYSAYIAYFCTDMNIAVGIMCSKSNTTVKPETIEERTQTT